MNAGPHRPNAAIQLRQPTRLQVPEAEHADTHLIVAAIASLQNQLGNLAKQVKDRSRPFDIYRPQTLNPDAETQITLQPEYEKPEVIETILITGPAGNVTLQLGERVWSLTIPATGFIVMSNLAIRVNRDDPRILTASVSGDYSLELMGHASE